MNALRYSCPCSGDLLIRCLTLVTTAEINVRSTMTVPSFNASFNQTGFKRCVERRTSFIECHGTDVTYVARQWRRRYAYSSNAALGYDCRQSTSLCRTAATGRPRSDADLRRRPQSAPRSANSGRSDANAHPSATPFRYPRRNQWCLRHGPRCQKRGPPWTILSVLLDGNAGQPPNPVCGLYAHIPCDNT